MISNGAENRIQISPVTIFSSSNIRLRQKLTIINVLPHSLQCRMKGKRNESCLGDGVHICKAIYVCLFSLYKKVIPAANSMCKFQFYKGKIKLEKGENIPDTRGKNRIKEQN